MPWGAFRLYSGRASRCHAAARRVTCNEVDDAEPVPGVVLRVEADAEGDDEGCVGQVQQQEGRRPHLVGAGQGGMNRQPQNGPLGPPGYRAQTVMVA